MTEGKSFAELIQQDLIPAIERRLIAQGVEPLELKLSFEQKPIPVLGFSQAPPCWQVIGRWPVGWQQYRQFNIYFLEESLKGQMGFSYSDNNSKASTFEPFLTEERKIEPELLAFWVVQRLNAQKWLARN